jgi:hypothetical protein
MHSPVTGGGSVAPDRNDDSIFLVFVRFVIRSSNLKDANRLGAFTFVGVIANATGMELFGVSGIVE